LFPLVDTLVFKGNSTTTYYIDGAKILTKSLTFWETPHERHRQQSTDRQTT